MELSEYANSKSVATPGASGAMIMLFANTLAFQFGLGDTTTRLIVLVLSFAAGFIVFIKDSSETSKIAKGVLLVFNTLIIFCVASGANTTGRNALEASKPESNNEVPHIKPITDIFSKTETPIFTFASFAQDTAHLKTDQRKKILKDQAVGVSNTIQDVQREILNNRQKYQDADQRLRELHAVNEQLLKLHETAGKQEAITHTEQRSYQLQLNAIQNDANKIRQGLTKKPATRQFFGNW